MLGVKSCTKTVLHGGACCQCAAKQGVIGISVKNLILVRDEYIRNLYWSDEKNVYHTHILI